MAAAASDGRAHESLPPFRRGAPWAVLLAALGALLAPTAAEAESDDLGLLTVLPALPGKNQVRWWELDWRISEFRPLEAGAPVRLFFYEQEREIARLAQPRIAQACRDHAARFDFTPDQPIPFLLYNSHFEFESTTAFFVSEGLLGVTSTEDLTVALPYWGELQRFEHVMRHELAHQFTLQKVLSAARRSRSCNPLPWLPLWLIEGIAEWGSRETLDAEARGAISALLAAGKLPRFFDEGPLGFARVYLVGHAQVRFLQESYGEDFVVRLLQGSPRLCVGPAFLSVPDTGESFAVYLLELAKVSREALERDWRAWLEKQIGPLPPEPYAGLEVVGELGAGAVDSFALAPDGRTLFYRTVDRDTGVARLYLRDLEDPGSRKLLTQDNRLGLSSLHAGGRRVVAIGESRLAYVGRSGPTDTLFVREWRRREHGGKVRFELGHEVRHPLGAPLALIEGGHPAIDPRTGAVWLSALSRATGFLDLYRFDAPLDPRAQPVRVTADPYAEVDLAFEPDGALLFASDATPDARFELARLRPDGGRTLLTDFPGPVDALAPTAAPGGGFVFQTDASGRQQAWRSRDGELEQLTDVVTWLQAPALDARGGLLGMALVEREPRLVRVAPERLGAAGRAQPAAAAGTPWQPELGTLDAVRGYAPLRDLRLESATALVSGGPLVYGNLAFADRFKGTLLGLDLRLQGDLDLSQGRLFYLDRSRRLGWAVAAFVDSGLQLERPNQVGDLIAADTYVRQQVGLQVALEYPLGLYTRVSGYVSPHVLRTIDFTDPASALAARGRRASPAFEVGARLAVDTTRLSVVGPVSGWSLTAGLSGTAVLGRQAPFAAADLELQASQPLVRGYDRLYLHERLALGQNFGSQFAEQFYVPAAYNLRALPEGSLRLIGNGYYLGRAELHFPIAPVVADFVYLQGLVGLDVGSVFFELDRAWQERVAAGVLGTSLGFGPLILRLQWARPFDVGAAPPPRRWLFYLSLLTPFGALFY